MNDEVLLETPPATAPATAVPLPPDEATTAPILDLAPSCAPPADGIDLITARVQAVVQAETERILGAFEHKLAYDATKQRQVDALHEEVQRHRAGLVARANRPLVQGVIRLHDDLDKLLIALRARPAAELTAAKFFGHLQEIQQDIEILLDQNSVTTYREQDDEFRPTRQRAVGRVGTALPELAGKVAEHLRPGFEIGVEILEKERVSLYFTEPAATPSAPIEPAPAPSEESP